MLWYGICEMLCYGASMVDMLWLCIEITICDASSYICVSYELSICVISVVVYLLVLIQCVQKIVQFESAPK